MRIFSSKKRIAVLIACIVLALFLLRPGASRLKSRIISSISAGVGRPVDIGSVHLQLLPRPGFDLENLVVYDDPAFGAEPILRASEVTASLRLTSLLRGRLEISRLDLTEPSLNLVHSDSGRWNLEALLERTAHMPLAPTGKSKAEPRPAFPYIEASSARINFKHGAEKKPYALTNADFSLWQDSENTWGVRLKAQPFRTDLNLNDLGLLQVSGTWQRADTFRDTPLQLNVEWNRAQLGQFTKLFTGTDKGWRGSILLDIALTGTPANLKFNSSGSIDDFRRYDITTGNALHLAASCDGEYSTITHEFHEVLCSGPVGSGLITVTGDMGLPGSHHFAVMLRAENVPAAAALMLAARAKKNLPDDLTADGTVHADFSMQEDAGRGEKLSVRGHGEIAALHVESLSNKAEIGPENLPFAFLGANSGPAAHQKNYRNTAAQVFGEGLTLEFGPVPIGTSHASSASVRGWIDRAGYDITINGEAEIARTLRLAQMIGVPALVTSAEGAAQIDLHIAGAWANPSGFVGPTPTGTVKLRNVRVTPHNVGAPVEIAAADMQLLPNETRITRLNAKVEGTNVTGSLEMPRGCGIACPVHFALDANEIVLSQMTSWADPGPKKRPWYRVLESSAQSGPSPLASVRASGSIHADQLIVHGLTAKHVSAKLSLESGMLQISGLMADFLGGKYHGEWVADFSVKPATCKGSGDFLGASLAGLATEMKDKWVTGVANASYEITGPCPAEFWQSAEGTLQVEIRNGFFPHLSLADTTDPLRVTQLSGEAVLRAGKIQIKDAKLDSPDGNYELSGAASLTKDIDLKLTRISGAQAGYAITGTLNAPRVAPLTRVEQARLKPAPAK
ncbi:MAG TPA: AsmA family protein [Candidatus Sulfotelmatobacter sp.]|nr:AsmA family protein [Candidatus Sulfotelmatobacter sp.]